MQFKKFELINFKGIDRVSLDISELKKPLCLLGMNEAGKSSILGGINTIGALCSGVSITNGTRHAIRPKRDPFDESVTLIAYILFEDDDRDAIDFDSGEAGTKATLKKIKNAIKEHPEVCIKFEFPYKKSIAQPSITSIHVNNEIKPAWQNPIFSAIKKNIPTIFYYSDVLFSAPEIIRFAGSHFSEEQPDRVRTDVNLNNQLNQSWQKIFSDILSGALKGPYSFQEDVVNKADSGELDAGSIKLRISKMNEYLQETITNEWFDINGEQTFDRIEIAPAMTRDGFHDFSLNVSSSGTPFSLHERSKGAQWYFCFKMLTEVRASNLSRRFIFLLDEPASNLHLTNQSKIYDALIKLNNQSNISIIYATHSSELTHIPPLVPDKSIDDFFNHIYLVINKYLDNHDKDSSGKIHAKKIGKITEADLATEEDKKLFLQSSMPLWHNIVNRVTFDYSEHDGEKELKSILKTIKDSINQVVENNPAIGLILKLVGLL